MNDLSLLSNSAKFILPAELAILAQCDEASLAWSESGREASRQHLRSAFEALRECLREGRGGRERSTPFVRNLESYLTFLKEALVPRELWVATKPSDRANTLIARWGEALPHVSMFTMPALARALRVQVDTGTEPKKADIAREGEWEAGLESILGENLEYASDFSTLEEVIAGKLSVRQRLEEFADGGVRLHHQEPELARRALERFCAFGDPDALHRVEWLFFAEPDNLRSACQGLKGLLIARKRRAPRENPIDRAARETVEALRALGGDESPILARFSSILSERKSLIDRDPSRAQEISQWLRSLLSGTSEAADQTAGQDLSRFTVDASKDPAVLQKPINLWEKIAAESRGDDAQRTNSLMLGLVQLFIQNLPDESTTGWLSLKAANAADERIILRAEEAPEVRELEIDPADLGAGVRGEIHDWLANDLCGHLFAQPEDDEEQEEDDLGEPNEVRIIVYRRHRRGDLQAMGTLALQWRQKWRRLVETTRSEVLTSWQVDVGNTAHSDPLKVLAEAFTPEAARAEVPTAMPAIGDHWTAYRASLGSGQPGWAIAALAGPISGPARNWVEAWYESLGLVDKASKGKEAERRTAEIVDELGKHPERAAELSKELKDLLQERTTKGATIEDVRSVLRVCTAEVRRAGAREHLILSPHHPLVLRLRALSDDILASIIAQLWGEGWPEGGLSDLRAAVRTWGLPETSRYYGFWEGEPLVFNTWTPGGAALYSRLGSGHETDARFLGVDMVAERLAALCDFVPSVCSTIEITSAWRHFRRVGMANT